MAGFPFFKERLQDQTVKFQDSREIPGKEEPPQSLRAAGRILLNGPEKIAG